MFTRKMWASIIVALSLCITLAAFLSIPVEAKPYKGAEIYSLEAVTYGRFEMSIKAAKGGGILSTFFLYKSGSENDGEFWEEIDIEIFGKDDTRVWQSNILLGRERPAVGSEQDHEADVSLTDDFHTYVIEWTPDYVAWFFNGDEVRRITAPSAVNSLSSAQTLRFNLWASESEAWTGSWSDAVLPVYQQVDYIRYQTYNSETGTFDDGWRDDFDTFDTTRWAKANWTFDTNRVDFSPENVTVKDGILFLALTKEGSEGIFPGSASSAASSAAVSSVASSSVAPAPAPVSSATAASAPSTSGGGGGGAMSPFMLFGLMLMSAFALRTQPQGRLRKN